MTSSTILSDERQLVPMTLGDVRRILQSSNDDFDVVFRAFEANTVERLGASDAVPSAYSLECCHLSSEWDETNKVVRGSPTQELINEIYETEGRWRIINFYDAAALARARQQGYEAARAELALAGCKAVPIEPTAVMCKAAADAWLDCGSRLVLNKAGAAARAAIAAAPAAARQPTQKEA